MLCKICAGRHLRQQCGSTQSGDTTSLQCAQQLCDQHVLHVLLACQCDSQHGICRCCAAVIFIGIFRRLRLLRLLSMGNGMLPRKWQACS